MLVNGWGTPLEELSLQVYKEMHLPAFCLPNERVCHVISSSLLTNKSYHTYLHTYHGSQDKGFTFSPSLDSHSLVFRWGSSLCQWTQLRRHLFLGHVCNRKIFLLGLVEDFGESMHLTHHLLYKVYASYLCFKIATRIRLARINWDTYLMELHYEANTDTLV